MRSLKSFWKFLNTQVGLLLLGFALTTIIGSYFADWFQRKNWERQAAFEAQRQGFEWERSKRFEILKRKLDEGQKSLEEISDLINLRFFRLQNVYEQIINGNLQSAKSKWQNYMDTVEQWNVKLIINQNKLKRLVGDSVSSEFNNYETDNYDLKNPKAIHGEFFVAHKKVKDLLKCLEKPSCTLSRDMKKDTNDSLRQLDYHSDEFVDRVSALFLRQAINLEEFQMPHTGSSISPVAQSMMDRRLSEIHEKRERLREQLGSSTK